MSEDDIRKYLLAIQKSCSYKDCFFADTKIIEIGEKDGFFNVEEDGKYWFEVRILVEKSYRVGEAATFEFHCNFYVSAIEPTVEGAAALTTIGLEAYNLFGIPISFLYWIVADSSQVKNVWRVDSEKFYSAARQMMSKYSIFAPSLNMRYFLVEDVNASGKNFCVIELAYETGKSVHMKCEIEWVTDLLGKHEDYVLTPALGSDVVFSEYNSRTRTQVVEDFLEAPFAQR